MPFNGFSEEYLDRLDNGNLPGDNKSYTKRELSALHIIWSCKILSNINRNCFSFSPLFLPMMLEKKTTKFPTDFEHGQVHRQLSVSSDSKLLDDDIREETNRVIMRPKKPPRPKSEVFLNKHDLHPRKKRFSAFGVSKHSRA